MLQNVRATAFTISELLRENQKGGGWLSYPPRLRLGLTGNWVYNFPDACKRKLN